MPHDLLLALDVGNTNITLGAYRGEELIAHWRMGTNRHITPDELALTLDGLFRLQGLAEPTHELVGAAASCVVPPLDRTIRDWGECYLDGRVLVVDRNVDLGIAIRYNPPEAVGADRLVNAVAAYRAYGGPCIVVDFGTATTYDAIAANGDYLGGAISPGLGISADALHRAASKLPRAELATPTTAIGATTAASLNSGLVFGYAAQVDGMVRRFRKELGEGARAIATGGLAGLICAETTEVEKVDPWLTLDGLRLIWGKTMNAE